LIEDQQDKKAPTKSGLFCLSAKCAPPLTACRHSFSSGAGLGGKRLPKADKISRVSMELFIEFSLTSFK
jgi:hypothetical protein